VLTVLCNVADNHIAQLPAVDKQYHLFPKKRYG
jgi:hypothetical protein